MALRANALGEAYALAEAAHRMVEQIPGAPPQALVASAYYGFLHGTVGGHPREALELCRKASRAVFWEPRVFEFLARMELLVGSRSAALGAVQRGLQLSASDRELNSLRRSLGMRQPPPLTFLDRGHPINVMLGKIRHRMQTGPVRVSA
jgi:hypothetical protein